MLTDSFCVLRSICGRGVIGGAGHVPPLPSTLPPLPTQETRLRCPYRVHELKSLQTEDWRRYILFLLTLFHKHSATIQSRGPKGCEREYGAAI